MYLQMGAYLLLNNNFGHTPEKDVFIECYFSHQSLGPPLPDTIRG